MPSLQALAAQQPADGLLVLGVNFREGEAAPVLQLTITA